MSDIAGRVVVVEDEGQIRRFVCDALRREGCAAVEAATARQGLDAAAADKPDLVILDLGLPDMSGLAFIGALRAWSKVPVLILSARVAEEDKIAALDAGADDYLTKPFGVPELLARLRAALRRGTRAPHDGQPVVEVQDGQSGLRVDLVARRCYRLAGEVATEVALTPTERCFKTQPASAKLWCCSSNVGSPAKVLRRSKNP